MLSLLGVVFVVLIYSLPPLTSSILWIAFALLKAVTTIVIHFSEKVVIEF